MKRFMAGIAMILASLLFLPSSAFAACSKGEDMGTPITGLCTIKSNRKSKRSVSTIMVKLPANGSRIETARQFVMRDACINSYKNANPGVKIIDDYTPSVTISRSGQVTMKIKIKPKYGPTGIITLKGTAGTKNGVSFCYRFRKGYETSWY